MNKAYHNTYPAFLEHYLRPDISKGITTESISEHARIFCGAIDYYLRPDISKGITTDTVKTPIYNTVINYLRPDISKGITTYLRRSMTTMMTQSSMLYYLRPDISKGITT